MELKKLGILTFWNVPNYGAFMQAYALQKSLENRYKEYLVKQIGYLNKKHFNVYYSNSLSSKYRYFIINLHFYKTLLKKIFLKLFSKNNSIVCSDLSNLKKFLNYYNSIPNFQCNKKSDLKKLQLDTLVLGSDIIWDYTVPFFGSDSFLFGNDINANIKISYAVGSGSVKNAKSVPGYVEKGIKSLNAISVRDKNTEYFVKQITDKKTSIVLDPTLLWDFDNDSNVINPNLDNYIIVYGSFFSHELINGAKEYSKKHHLKLICLSSLDDKFDWCDRIINQDELSPFEWVGYFKYAKAVMTCTYHGLMFSLIFKKKIIFYMTNFILNKSESFIDELGLTDVIISFKSFNEKINWDWDYNLISEKIDILRQKSFKFLDESINDK